VRVPADLPRWRRAAELIGRRAESAVLDQVIGAVRAGQSRALVVYGEPGVGKTALLDQVAVAARNFQVIRAGGVQSEMELAYAGLHQLCLPLLDRIGQLPQPQAQALRTAFGIDTGPAPERFLIGLAVLGLLSDAAHDQPMMCLLDDYQWLDRTSAQVLAFVARRLGAESVGLVIATRVVGEDLHGLPELAVGGLRASDAGDLLDSVLTSPVDARVREQIIADTHGNPLALLELPRWLTPAQLAGGFGLPGALPLSNTIEDSFGRRAAALPASAQRFLLVAASDPSGDPTLVSKAAAQLGLDADAAAPAVKAGLVEVGTRVRFPHPLVRSAVYQAASREQRRQVHGALAEATDPELDPDRRAWHRAQAATGPDEEVAIELERSASRAQARGGVAAASAFLVRAATLTEDPARRADRALAAGRALIQTGSFDEALDLLSMTEAAVRTDAQRARIATIRAELAFVMNRGNDAAPLLLDAARRLETIDPAAARATYLDALSAAIFAGGMAAPGGDLRTVARAVRAAPPPPANPPASDLLLDGMAAMYNSGFEAGLPLLRDALAAFRVGVPTGDQLRWLWLASITAMTLCDDELWDVVTERHVALARSTGAVSQLPIALTLRAMFLLFSGDLTAAWMLADEMQATKDATGLHLAPIGAVGVLAFRGDEALAVPAFQAAIEDATQRGEGVGITMTHWARAAFNNGLGRYRDAVSSAQRAIDPESDRGSHVLRWIELIEGAVRSDQPKIAEDAYGRLADLTTATGTQWALGLLARSTALLSSGDEAESAYRESIERLGRTRMRLDLGRAHLLFGEWLRRERRNSAAREELRTARNMLGPMGVTGFAERAARELRAAGESVRKRTKANRRDELTAQEAQIARMARDGLSNPEIASRLFLSPYTVQYHLRKVFTKLGISSRGQLERVLPHNPDT
jgi:DNA-binding CsgD family transcriptional regulator